MKSIINKFKQSTLEDKKANTVQDNQEVDHLWVREEQEAKKPKSVKDPRIDTGILRNRIAEKLAKTNNY